MKLKTDAKTLRNVVKQAAKLAKRGTMPVLEHVAIDFDGYVARITSNDLERTYSETFPAEGEPGQAVVPAAKLAQVINAAKGDVNITPDKVSAGRSRVKLLSLPYGEFPQPDYEEGQVVGCDAMELGRAIGAVVHAMPTKDSRPMLNGVHLTNGYAVATDGHRMAVAECGYDGPDVILPPESARLMTDFAGEVRVSECQIIVDGQGFRFSTGLIDAKYLDWRRVMPTDCTESFTCNSAEIIEAAKVAALGDDMYKKGLIVAEGGELTITNANAESGCDCTSTGRIEIAFNLQYLVDAIEAEGTDEVTVQVVAADKGALVGRYNVVMPVRL